MNVFFYLFKNRNNIDIINTHGYSYLSTFQATIFCLICRKPLILTHHGMGVLFQDDYYQKSFFMKQIILKILKLICMINVNLSKQIIAVSKRDIPYLINSFKIKEIDKIKWIPNALRIDDINSIINISNKRKYITFIGSLEKIKGFDIFLKIASRLNTKIKNLSFLIIGKGKLSYLIKKYYRNLNLKYIPFIPNKYIKNIFQLTKIFVITSRSEGLPTTLLEAMASKIPIVSTSVGGIPDIIKDGHNGFLFNPNNIEAGVNKIITLYNNNDLQKKFGENSRKLLEEKLLWSKIIKKYIKIINNLQKY